MNHRDFTIRIYLTPNKRPTMDAGDVDEFLRSDGRNEITFDRKINVMRLLCERIMSNYPNDITDSISMVTHNDNVHTLTMTFEK